MNTLKITYIDGRTDTAAITAAVQCKAEEHAQTARWGTIEECKMRFTYFSAYTALRMSGLVTDPFDTWLGTVSTVTFAHGKDDTGNPTI